MLGNIVLPPWSKGDPHEFIRVHREVSEGGREDGIEGGGKWTKKRDLGRREGGSGGEEGEEGGREEGGRGRERGGGRDGRKDLCASTALTISCLPPVS